jgi:hypothetical protein
LLGNWVVDTVVDGVVVVAAVEVRIDYLDSFQDKMAFDVDIVVVVAAVVGAMVALDSYMDCYNVAFVMDTAQKWSSFRCRCLRFHSSPLDFAYRHSLRSCSSLVYTF